MSIPYTHDSRVTSGRIVLHREDALRLAIYPADNVCVSLAAEGGEGEHASSSATKKQKKRIYAVATVYDPDLIRDEDDDEDEFAGVYDASKGFLEGDEDDDEEDEEEGRGGGKNDESNKEKKPIAVAPKRKKNAVIVPTLGTVSVHKEWLSSLFQQHHDEDDDDGDRAFPNNQLILEVQELEEAGGIIVEWTSSMQNNNNNNNNKNNKKDNGNDTNNPHHAGAAAAGADGGDGIMTDSLAASLVCDFFGISTVERMKSGATVTSRDCMDVETAAKAMGIDLRPKQAAGLQEHAERARCKFLPVCKGQRIAIFDDSSEDIHGDEAALSSKEKSESQEKQHGDTSDTKKTGGQESSSFSRKEWIFVVRRLTNKGGRILGEGEGAVVGPNTQVEVVEGGD